MTFWNAAAIQFALYITPHYSLPRVAQSKSTFHSWEEFPLKFPDSFLFSFISYPHYLL